MVSLGVKELWTDLEGREFYPVRKLKDFIHTLSIHESEDGISFDFSGIEQVTDLVLHTLSSSLDDKTAANVKEIDLTGCHHVTDYGVGLLTSAFPNLEKVILDGCKAVTEKSVFRLKTRCPHLSHLSMVAADVGHLPLQLGDTDVKLDGCPLYNGVDGIRPETSSLVPLNEQKIVILAQPTLTFSVFDILKGETENETKETGRHFLYSPKVTVGSITANVFQFSTESTHDYLPFLSSGAIYIIAVEFTTAEECARSIQETYLSIKTQTSSACVVVVISHQDDEDTKTVKKMVQNYLQSSDDALEACLLQSSSGNKDFCSQKLRAKNLANLSTQREGLMRLSFLSFNMKTRKVCQLGSDTEVTSEVNGAGASKEENNNKENVLLNELLSSCQHLQEQLPWECRHVTEDVMQFCENLPKDRILTFDDLVLKTKGQMFPTDSVRPYRKLLLRLHQMGRLVYCPNTYHETVILDVQWFMDVLTIPHDTAESWKGNLTSLPETVPLFTESQFRALYASHCSEQELIILINLIKVLRLVCRIPHWPINGEGKLTLLTFTSDLPWLPSVHHAGSDVEFWGEFWPEKKLPTDVEINYRYEVYSGIPAAAICWITSKLYQRHDVLFLWRHGIIFREGAVEVLLMKKDRSVPCIEIQARCTRFESGQGKMDTILADYMWNVLNDVCLLVESILHSFTRCSFAAIIPCPGNCPSNKGGHHTVNPDDLTSVINQTVSCQKCSESVDKNMYKFISGRQRGLPFHDWRSEKFGYRCSACRSYEGRIMKQWSMECQLNPNFTNQCFKLYNEGEITGSRIPGNTVISDSDGLSYMISEYPLSEADFKEVKLDIVDPTGLVFYLIKDPIKYLQKDLEDRRKLTYFGLDLETGDQVHIVETSAEVVPFRRGDQMTVSIIRQKEDTDDSDSSLFVCDVKKNGVLLHQFLLPEKCHVVIKSERSNEPGGVIRAIVSSQYCPVVTSAHFQVGTCLLHKLDDGATWWGGVIEKIEDGYLYVVRTTADGLAIESKRFLPDSDDLAPLCHFPPEAEVVLIKEPVTTTEGIFSYLKQFFLTPAPMGLFPRFCKMPDYKPLQLQSLKPRFCMTSIYHPSMLHRSFRVTGKPAVLKRQPIGFIILPVGLKLHHLYHTGRQLTQDWENQGIGFMCKGEMLAHSTIRIGHLQDGKVAPLTSEKLQLFSADAKAKFWKFLVNSVYYLLQSYGQLTAQPPIVSSWMHLLPDIPQDTDHDLISEGLSKLTRWYQHTLILFCALSSSLNHFYPPYFNGKEFNDIISKITKVMKDELHPNNEFGFCDTHHYLLRAFKVKKDQANPDSLPKLEMDLTKLGSSTMCVRELKIEEFASDSVPQVVLESMQQFPNLIRVQLSKCGLTSVRGIETCKNLKTLEVDSNNIESLHDGFENLKYTLEVLSLNDNPLKELPVFITQFPKLNHIAVANTLITDLPEDIGDLTNLQTLDISKNRISRLPESFKKLKNLESLTFSGIPYLFYAFKKGVLVSKKHFLNWCSQKLNGAHSMSTFTEEEKVAIFNSCHKDSSDVLTHKGLHQLNNHLFWKLPRLGLGEGAASDPYGAIPPQIFSCRRLTSLTLSFQGIRVLPDDFKKLRHLQKLIVDHCDMLRTVSAEVGKLPLQTLIVGQCRKLQTPPPEVVQQGMNYTLHYMRKLAAGSQACYRTKLMFVGLGGAGKTSLMRSMMSGDLMCPPIGSEGITDGIDIKNWVVNRENQALTYSVWDFAGQTVYYNTHQFFLTSRAIYFLTWNSRLGFEHAGLEFWLSSIQCHAPKAPVFVVGTHADQVSKSDLPKDDLKRNYPSIVGFYSVSSLTGTGMRALIDDLIHTTLQQPYIGEQVPEAWIQMERSLARERDKKCNVMNWDDITELALKHDLDEAEIKQAVKFLHDLGSLQHFDNESLKDKVVINPQWVVDVMACVVSVHNSCIKEGRLKYEDISKIWSEYPIDLHDWLLRLTEAFDLTFPLPDQKVNIVPCLLPQAKPVFTWPEMLPDDGTRKAKILYRFDILPAGLFNRAQVRLYQISDSSSMWKRGSLLNKNDHVGLMTMRGASEVLVKAHGPRPENIIFLVHEVFESLISEYFKGVSYEYLIPCSDCMKHDSKDPTMFSSTVLRRAITLKAPFIQCHSSFHSLPISDVQAYMPPQMSDDFDLQFHMTMKELERMQESFTHDCGIVYSQADVPEDGADAIHPIRVAKDLETMEDGYKCWYREGIESLPLNDVLKSLGDCKCIIVFISENFTKDHFCEQIFRFVSETLKKPIILVTVGRGHGWRNSDIGIKMSDKVYINMQRPWQYQSKLGVLEKKLRMILGSDMPERRCDVFISYSWLNSVQAIQAGHISRKEEAIGFGDPREIKWFLEKNGVSCWMDIEQTGVDGLFEDIAKGLKQCKVMLACISNEYALSGNCQMEFRFAAVTLKMPIVLAVVGRGYAWESTEIGLLSLGHDKCNFQINNNECYDQLLSDIKEKLQSVDRPEEVVQNPGQPQGFRELYELAQRKFMRQFSGYSENGHEYPRLFVVDTVMQKFDESSSIKDADLLELEVMDENQEGEEVVKDSSDYCFRILCEYEEGWHACHDGFPINLIGNELEQLWKSTAPYFGRILKLLKHSNVDLNCFSTLEGDQLFRVLENNVGVNVDLKPIYLEIRQHIMRKDAEMTYGGLKLCYLPNGKYLWLCPEHQELPRVTILESETPLGSASETELTEDILLEKLSKFDETSKFSKGEKWKQGKRQKRQKGGKKWKNKGERGEKKEEVKETGEKEDLTTPEGGKGPNGAEQEGGGTAEEGSTKKSGEDLGKSGGKNDADSVEKLKDLAAHSAPVDETTQNGVKEEAPQRIRPKTAPSTGHSRPRILRASSFSGIPANDTSKACVII